MGEHIGGEASQEMVEVLIQAGYRMEHPKEWQSGLVAYNSALMLKMLISKGSGHARGRKIGRNEPCPCGSGKKHKKCCLGKEQGSGGGPLMAELRRPGPPPAAMLPRLDNLEAMADDMNLLVKLMDEDPDLCKIRFPPAQVSRFFDKHLPDDFETLSKDESDEIIDHIANRFNRKHDQTPVFKAFMDAVVRVGRRVQDMSELRALSLGYFLAISETADTDDQFKGGPLAVAFFRISLFTGDPDSEGLDRAFDALKGFAAKGLKRGEMPDDIDEIVSSIKEQMPDDVLQALDQITAEANDVFDAVRDGEFPVLLPYPCVAKLLWSMKQTIDHEDEKTTERLKDLLHQTVTDFCEEDRRLWGQAIRYHMDTGIEPEWEKQARLLLLLLQVPLQDVQVMEFVVAVLRQARFGRLPWEDEVSSQEDEEEARQDFLERYGDRLLEEGFPTLAARIWSCCEYLGPVPETVKAKIQSLRDEDPL